jgi:hypothetical protein
MLFQLKLVVLFYDTQKFLHWQHYIFRV